jgi:hypothetical protein
LLQRAIVDSGWGYRPVILPVQAMRRQAKLLRALTPPPLRQLSPRRMWGILYPLSYGLALAWFFLLGPAELRTARNLGLAGLITLGWWSVWGLLTWMLCRFSNE